MSNRNYTIKSIHSNIGMFNGYISFIVDNKILFLEVCTPVFNDYNEFRLRNLTLSSEDYRPEENTVTLKPYNIEDFIIDEDELNYLNLWFSNSCEELYNLDMVNQQADSPYIYLDPNEILTSVSYDTGYRHLINEPNTYNPELDCFDNDKSKWLLTSEISNKKLYQVGGMCRLLAHISDGIFKNYYKQGE